MNSFFTLHIFLEFGKTQDLPSKFCQTLGDALRWREERMKEGRERRDEPSNSLFVWLVADAGLF
jgi:hypothetical protein